MIIQISGFLRLDDYLNNQNNLELELPRLCPECADTLWNHGCRWRTAKTLTGRAERVRIQRLICRGCSLTVSCLFAFLRPWKHFVLEVFTTYIQAFNEQECTYRDVAWADHDGDNLDAEASLARAFRAVDEVATVSEQLAQEAQKLCVERGENLLLDDASREPSPNSSRARSADKAEKLEKLAYFLRLAGRFKCDLLAKLLSYCVRICDGYPNSKPRLRLSAPHGLKQALF